ncbi:MAG: hypothetical protein HQL76_12960 [Magnetococcales bacterium]|nr:hypothetical protein [Magnetococcales bacterium]
MACHRDIDFTLSESITHIMQGYNTLPADPDGHPWEIIWAPMFPLGPAGELHLP